MKKKYILTIIFVLCGLLILICGCTDSSEEKVLPSLIEVDDVEPTGTSVKLSVSKYTKSLKLFELVSVTKGSVWKVYDSNDNVMSNKIVNLEDGNNTFYIEVAYPDGSYSKTYILKVFKSYDVKVTYVYKFLQYTENFGSYVTLKEEVIEYGENFVADYIPEIYGYDFYNWYVKYDKTPFTEGKMYSDTKIIANAKPKTTRVHIMLDGEEWQVIDSWYQKQIYIPTPPEKKHYYFDGWKCDVQGLNYDEFYCFDWGDVYIYGNYKPKSYTITYDYIYYGSRDAQYYVKYGEDFVMKEPKYKSITVNGIEYVLDGFLYNGEPFTSGKYLYDGDITVTANWVPKDASR